MKLIKPSYEILPQAPGLEGVYKQIEKAGRVCYKSEDKITEISAKEFVDMLIKRGHLSVLEHGTVYLDFTDEWPYEKYIENPYSKVYKNTLENNWEAPHLYVTTNMRVIIENGWEDDLKYICEPTKYHVKRTTVKFICSRSTSHQLVRHRVMSFAQESQRYCNYSLNKFNNEITFIRPSWLDDNKVCTDFDFGLIDAETRYFNMIKLGYKPQQARQILPNACKTELVVTGFNDDWKQLLELRCSAGADPDIKQLMNPLKEELCIGQE